MHKNSGSADRNSISIPNNPESAQKNNSESVHTHGGFKRPRKKIDTNTIRRLMSYVLQYKLRFSLVLIAIVISAAANVIGSMFIKVLIDDYVTPLLLLAEPNFAGLFQAITYMGSIYLIGMFSSLFFTRTMVVIAQGVLKKIRDDMFAHMQTLPIKYFDTHSHGDIMSRYTNDTDTLRQMISMSIPQVLSSLVTIVSVFFAMLYMSAWLTLFVIVFIFFQLQVTKYITGRSRKYFVKQQASLGEANGFIEEMINGQKVIKVFTHERQTEKEFDLLNDELCEHATAAHRFANILMPIMGNLGNLQYVLIAIVGGALAILGAPNISLAGSSILTLGMIASFLSLSRSFSMPLAHVSNQLNMVVMALAGAERIFRLMDEESETDDGYVTLVHAEYQKGELIETDKPAERWAWKQYKEDGTATYTELKGEVRFYDVDFEYERDVPVLNNITLYAKPSQKLAFVGATGAGKTTITNLLNRFYDIADGKIRFDGININRIKKADLRHSLGIVLQDVNLFTGTVMENIRYGKLDATDEEVYEAARLANADDFIRRLPNGYNTMLQGDGGSLSQGQKQLISIARAAVANPPVMILDEATSSIDTRTEAIVQKGMDSLMHGRTVFVIAHRLSTIQNANAIIVLEDGRIIERGDHDKLIAEKGKYFQLYTGAFELE